MREDYKVILILLIEFIKLEIKMPFLLVFEKISLYKYTCYELIFLLFL